MDIDRWIKNSSDFWANLVRITKKKARERQEVIRLQRTNDYHPMFGDNKLVAWDASTGLEKRYP